VLNYNTSRIPTLLKERFALEIDVMVTKRAVYTVYIFEKFNCFEIIP